MPIAPFYLELYSKNPFLAVIACQRARAGPSLAGKCNASKARPGPLLFTRCLALAGPLTLKTGLYMLFWALFRSGRVPGPVIRPGHLSGGKARLGP